MATANQTAREKFLEARKAWVDAVTARKQAYWEIISAQEGWVVQAQPTTPVAQPVNPSTGLSTPLPPTVQPTNPPVAPVAQPAPTTPPVTPPVTPPKQDTPSPVTPPKTEDFNTSAGRETQIQDNVSKITQQNPNLLKDRNAYNQAFWYETADPGKKAILDASFLSGNTPMNQDDIVKSLIAGVTVPEQKTAAYRNAVKISEEFKKFNAMTDTQLLDNLKQGQIGSQMDSLLNQNPNYAKAKEKLSKEQKIASLNRAGRYMLSAANWQEIQTEDKLNKVEAKYNAPIWANQQAYEDFIVKNPDVIKYGTQLKSINSQILEISTTYTDALKQLKKDYPDMSPSALITLMTSRTKDTKELLDSLESQRTLIEGDFDLAMKMAEGEYGAVKEDIKYQQDIEKEQRTMQNSLALSQMQFDQQIAQQAQAMNDPTTAISTMVEEYKKLGIPFSRSTQQIIADFQASWLDLPTYLSQLQQTIQAKPEYQAIQEQNLNKWTSFQSFWWKVYKVQNWQLIDTWFSSIAPEAQKTPDWKQDASGNWYNANSPISPSTQASSLSPVAISQISTRLQGNNIQCGMVSNDYAKIKFPNAPRMLDSYASKIATIEAIWESSTPEVWALFVMDTGTSTGHTGIVTAVNPDGTFTATDANRSGSKDWWPLESNTYKINDKVRFSNPPANTGNAGEQISSSSLPLYRSYMEDWKLPSKDALKGLWMTSEQFVDSAQDGYSAYLASKEQEINSTYPTLQIKFTPSYSNISATQKEKLNESMTKIGDIDQRIERLKTLFKKSWTEVLPTKTKSEMNSLRQQIILKAKEVENLWVLNWPDLWILESLLPETTGITSGLFSFDSNTLAKLESIQNNYRSDAKTKGINYGAKISFKWEEGTGAGQTMTDEQIADAIIKNLQSK